MSHPVAACRRPLLAGLAVTLAAGVLAAPAGADTRIRGNDAAFVSAWAGDLVWTEPSRPARWRLRGLIDGRVRTLRARPSTGLIDADLGRRSRSREHGRVVYQRCRGLERCDLYRIDLPSGRERRLRSLSSSRHLEAAPSQWDGTYAFGRFAPGEPQAGTSRRGGLFVARPGRRPKRITRRVPVDTDVAGRRIAYAWFSARGPASAVYVTTTSGRRHCRLDRGTSRRYVHSPVIDGRWAYWLRVESATGEARVARAPLPSTSCRRRGATEVSERSLARPSGGEEGGADSLAVTGGSVFYSALGVYLADDPVPFP